MMDMVSGAMVPETEPKERSHAEIIARRSQQVIDDLIASAREEGRREVIDALRDGSKFLRIYAQSSLDGNVYRINSQGKWEIIKL